MRLFLLFFSVQFANYFINTLDVRALAHQQYLMAATVNAVLPIIAWIMVKKIGECQNERIGIAAVAVGGSLAAVAGMWFTRAWG